MIPKQYDLFISYAHADDEHGWVTALHDQILADHPGHSTEELRVFFDTRELRDMADWEHRIMGALQSASVLLICISPNYRDSPFCRRELKEYLLRQAHHRVTGEGIAQVYFVETPLVEGDREDEDDRWWRDQLARHQTDLRPWFPEGQAALAREEVDRRIREAVKRVGPQISERIVHQRLAEAVPGNVRAPARQFVGRREEIRRLHDDVYNSASGTFAVLHGPGGFGKTELAIAYANAYAAFYQGGIWQVPAEGAEDLLGLIGRLATDPRLGLTATEEQRADPQLLGLAVLAELESRVRALRSANPGQKTRALLLVDNVDRPGLLSVGQVDQLSGYDWLRVAVTTRLGPKEFGAQGSLAAISVGPLDQDAALALLREHQPVLDGVRRFSSPAEESAAAGIAAELAGFTLALEQVAVHLPLTETEPSQYLSQLRARGPVSIDEDSLDQNSELDAIRHQEKLVAFVLDSTTSSLPPAASRPSAWPRCYRRTRCRGRGCRSCTTSNMTRRTGWT